MSHAGAHTNNKPPRPHTKRVHYVLAHSYFIYFLLFVAGVFLDIVFKIKIFSSNVVLPFGVGLMVLSSALIFWAQNTSRTLKKHDLTKDDFCRGPYKYTRSPTHLGLFLLILSFGIITNAFFVILFTIASFFITKFTFLKKQEEILVHRYGEPYIQYGKIVKF